MLRRLSLFLVLLLSIPARADELTCGTTPDLVESTREMTAFSRARAQLMASKGLRTSTASVQDNVVVLRADDTNAPFLRPFDLHGRTLVFTPASDGYSVRNIPLEYDADTGPALLIGEYATVSLDFDFPFHGRNVRQLFVTRNTGIFLEEPDLSDLRQYSDLDLIAYPTGVISPLLTTDRSRLTVPSVRARKTSNSVVLSWIAANRYDVQAVLSNSGEIRFSYREVTQYPAAGGIVITSGSEPWRNERATLTSATDAAGDLRSGAPQAVAPLLDLRETTISRISGLDLYEVRLNVAAAVTRRSEGVLAFNVAFGEGQSTQTVRLTLTSNGTTIYRLPGWSQANGSEAVTIDGSTVVMRFMQEHVPLSGVTAVRAFTTFNGTLIDQSAVLAVPLDAAPRRVRTDFSAITEEVIASRPIAEAFTAPILSVERVWDQVKESLPLTDNDIDGVAIYQNFLTDLVLYAGAYSTGGNPAASGLSRGDEPSVTEPRSPALMHMNAVGYGHNRTSPGASRVVLHEFGHRWLLFVTLKENGANSQVLNPVSAHPAQYVDTRAAFRVYTDSDTSVMGGGYFTTNADGTFSSGPYGPYGYSWLDLYLMGLADADEVQPFFYIADSQPQLAGEYYAPPNGQYSGTRRDVRLDQIIDGTGIRVPAQRDAQKKFRVAFVLLTSGAEPTQFDREQMALYRRLIEEDFRTATNGRGEVTTAIETPAAPGPRRRAARK